MSGLPHDDDHQRLKALRRFQILDTPPEERFDRITRLTARLLEAPFVLLSFFDAERTWCKSSYGLVPVTLPRSLSLGQDVLARGEISIVRDAAADPRFREHPLLNRTPPVRFYAGAPLLTPDDQVLGVLSMLDTAPRTLTAQEVLQLEDMAALAVGELERRRTALETRFTASAPAPSSSEPPEPSEEKRWQDLIEHHPEAVLIISSDGVIRYSNPSGARLFGLSLAGDLMGASIFDYVLPRQHRDVKNRLEALDAHETLPRREYVITRVDGQQRHVEARSLATTYQGRPALQSVIYDVTDKRQTRAILRASEGRYRRLLEKAKDAIFIADAYTGKLVEANQAAQRLIGRSAEEIHRMNQSDLYPPEDREKYNSLFQAGVFEDSAVGDDRYVVDSSGNHIPVEISASVIEVNDRRLVQSIFRDLTERKQHEKELLAAKRKAEQMSQLKSAFLTNMNHEIRTPLTSILGYSELLAEEVPPHMLEHVQSIRTSGMRLLDTLSSVLNLAQLERHTFRLNPKPLDLRKEVREAAALFRPRAKEHNLQFSCNVPEEAVSAKLDRFALSQVLRNLINNAIRFTPSGSVTICLETAKPHVKITVADTGIGISKSFQAHLFDEFKQEFGAKRLSQEGAGLGLSITKRLVELMDGRIEIESEKGQGSTFSVFFPQYTTTSRQAA